MVDQTLVVLHSESDCPSTRWEAFPFVGLSGGIDIVLRVSVTIRVGVSIEVPVVLDKVLLGVACGVFRLAPSP